MKIRGPGHSYVDKMNAIEWFSRYSEYLTQDIIHSAVSYMF